MTAGPSSMFPSNRQLSQAAAAHSTSILDFLKGERGSRNWSGKQEPAQPGRHAGRGGVSRKEGRKPASITHPGPPWRMAWEDWRAADRRRRAASCSRNGTGFKFQGCWAWSPRELHLGPQCHPLPPNPVLGESQPGPGLAI